MIYLKPARWLHKNTRALQNAIWYFSVLLKTYLGHFFALFQILEEIDMAAWSNEALYSTPSRVITLINISWVKELWLAFWFVK